MIYQLTPDIYRLQIPFSNIYTCMFLIRTADGTVVYDTGTYSSDISNYLAPALQELGLDQPRYVVLSHNHGDHAGGLTAFCRLFPDAEICAGSDACSERVNAPVRILTDGMQICHSITAVHIPGHTTDCTAIYDSRTQTLLSADCLQAYGIFGKGRWGSSIVCPQAHLEALDRLEKMEIRALYTAHDYVPCGNSATDPQEVKNYIHKCRQALADIEAYVQTHPGQTPEEQAQNYAKEKGIPIPPEKTFVAMQ